MGKVDPGELPRGGRMTRCDGLRSLGGRPDAAWPDANGRSNLICFADNTVPLFSSIYGPQNRKVGWSGGCNLGFNNL
jgi:hypothetical protein